MKNKKYMLFTALMLIVFAFGLVGCQPAAEQPAAEQPAAEQPAAEQPAAEQPVAEQPAAEEPAAEELMAEEMDFITWYQYDQDNTDPASDERVGNEYLAKNIPLFNADFEGKWNWVNIPKAWDKQTAELVAAVISGGDVPDLIELGGQQTITYVNNGALMDITDWVMAQPWYADLEPSALLACTGPDGKIYCVPTAERPHLTYVWADHYPNGYPTTPEEFMTEAARLKEEGTYAWTYFGSTAYGGNSTGRMFFALIDSFGGTYDDGKGNMLLNTPENVAAIEFLRETVIRGYNPETVFAGGFVEEDSFKDSSAAAIPTGLFGYRYINPLTAPNGTEYATGSSQDMIDAIAAGDVVMRPMFAPEGEIPGCNLDIQGLGIPTGAQNVEAAYDHINWVLGDLDRHIEYVLGPGAGFPSLLSAQELPEMQLPFYKEAAGAINQSVCRNWAGSLERPSEASEAIANVIYKLIKEDQTADIATELQKVQDEYNSNN